MITLHKLLYIISPGSATINASATDYVSGSGIDRVKISVNEETIYDTPIAENHPYGLNGTLPQTMARHTTFMLKCGIQREIE